MKYLFLISFCVPFLCVSQNESFRFVSSDNEWVVENGNLMTWWPRDIRNYNFSKDSTIIDGKFYHNLVWKDADSTSNQTGTLGFFRENNGKTFRYFSMDSTEKIVYDFNLVEGDTIQRFNLSQSSLIVGEVGFTELLDGKQRKFYEIKTPCGNLEVIEGVGEIEGFLSIINTCSLNEGFNCLHQYSSKNQVLFEKNRPKHCWYTSSIKESTINNVRVSSNPIVNNFTITWESFNQKMNLKIYNVAGLEIEKKSIQSGEIIDCTSWINGIYFYHLYDEHTDFTGKIIKIR